MEVLLFFSLLAIAQARTFPCNELTESDLDRPLYPSSIIDIINSDPDAGWTAGVNQRFINSTIRDIKRLGSASFPELLETPAPTASETLRQIPYEFDSRSYWNCPSMRRILNQGVCGACWAFSTIQVLQDRMCIFFGIDVSLSPDDVLTCCTQCGNCDSGWPDRAFEYLATKGTVTSTCAPYFDTSACGQQCKAADTPVCRRVCVNSEDYSRKFYSRLPYFLRSIPQIQQEIMLKGPVVAGMNVYEDFQHYKTGVYRYKTGKFIIKHAVKLIGWGVTSQGTKYWLATNQWSTGWGEGGHFRIAMGVNECGIESYVLAADPVYPQYQSHELYVA